MGAGVPRDKSGSAFPSAEFLKIASKSSLATGNGKAGTKNHALYEACMHDFDNVDINHERGAISRDRPIWVQPIPIPIYVPGRYFCRY